MENMKKLNNMIFNSKNIDIYKTAYTHPWNPVSKVVYNDTLSYVLGL